MRRVLAAPREAGTPAAAAARAVVTEHLVSLGYQVALQPFRFAPASLLALPLFGAGLGWLALLLVPLLVSPTILWAALAFWVGGVVALAVVAAGVGLGRIPLGAEPRDDANLVATRGEGPIRRWIVAHLDTKAQGHSMAGRLVAVWAVAVAVAVLTTLTTARL